MKALSRLIAGIFNSSRRADIDAYREWDRLRSRAMSPSEISEIDAIFSRNL